MPKLVKVSGLLIGLKAQPPNLPCNRCQCAGKVKLIYKNPTLTPAGIDITKLNSDDKKIAISSLIANLAIPIHVAKRPTGKSAFEDEKEVGTWQPVMKGNTNLRAVVVVLDLYDNWLGAKDPSDYVEVT